MFSKIFKACLAPICVLAVYSILFSAEIPKNRDLISLHWPAEVALSPDGSAIAFVVQVTNWEKDCFDKEIWIAREGNKAEAFVKDRGSNGSLKWSPNGRFLYFLSNRTGENQLYRIPVDGGEAEALTKIERGDCGL